MKRSTSRRTESRPVHVGVIGYGYWGPNIVRNLHESTRAHVAWICDLRGEQTARARKRYPGVGVSSIPEEVISDPTVAAIVIATPVATHFELGRAALEAGKHLLIEKPLAATVEQAEILVDLARRKGCVLLVDHTFIYTGAVQRIRELLDERQLGELYYYDSVRVNLGLLQHDVNVLWDLAVHDLAIMDFLLGRTPVAVSVTGAAHFPGRPVDMAYLTLFFESNLIAHVHVNWLAPVKIRQTLIGGDRKMIVYDDLVPDEKVRVYDRGVTVNDADGVYEMLVGYRAGDVWVPKLDRSEALFTEILHFIDCIGGKAQPLTDGDAGLRVVRILQAADRSLGDDGRRVRLA